MAATRMLSHSELNMALTCPAKWDFAYGGRIAGSTLKRRVVSPTLTGGRAWGAAVAAWHARGGTTEATLHAHHALRESLRLDYEQMAENGVFIPFNDVFALEAKLGSILDHYVSTVQPLDNLTLLEHDVLIFIPALNGSGRRSNRWCYLAKLDGYTHDREGFQWPVEFKLRGSLSSFKQVQRSRQPRWYCYALAVHQGFNPFGILVEETLAEPPRLPKIVNDTRKKAERTPSGRVPSTDIRQLVRPEDYVAACEEYGVEPNADTLGHFQSIRWTVRHPIVMTDAELRESGQELRDLAVTIRDLDSGRRLPVRNAQPMICRYCQFDPICDQPEDDLFVQSLYTRSTPKRLKPNYEPNGVPA